VSGSLAAAAGREVEAAEIVRAADTLRISGASWPELGSERAPDTGSLLAKTPTAWSHASAVSTPAPRPGAGVPGRRTVTIRGRGAERDLAFPAQRTSRRPATRPHERPGFKPDRAAMWAILLGIFLVLVAATSSHAATLRSSAGVHRAALERPATRVVRVSAGSRW
jgi:hypothetical protein